MTRPDPMADGTLAALAKRVEAEEPSFALEVEIAKKIGFPWTPYPPAFMCSIDAAAMAMPDGWAIDMILYVPSEGAFNVTLSNGPRVIGSEVKGRHAEARARLAAALRARDAGGA